jgi:hypothetical protein
MTIRNRYALAVCASILAFGFAACEKQGPAEKAGEEIDEALDTAGNKVEKAADEVKEEVNEAADEVKDATN